MKRIYGYVRVSTEIQKEKDNSIKNQINHIEDYCNRYDLELVKIFSDNGISGKERLNRESDWKIEKIEIYFC